MGYVLNQNQSPEKEDWKIRWRIFGSEDQPW